MTQGLVSVTREGQVILKCVAGCNGYNAQKLADRLKAERITSPFKAWDVALEIGFGCEACLVTLSKDCMLAEDTDELDPRYRTTFNDPKFNPRWQFGTADHTVVVEVEA